MHADLSVLADLGALLAVAVALAWIGARFRIPAVVAYLATGVVLGPPGLGLLGHDASLETLAELGVILLLFTIGLEFDLGTLRRMWRAVLLGGGLHVLATTAVVTVLAGGFGLSWGAAVVWGFLVALSSTAVVLRLIEDRGESAQPHGRLVTGVLIFQDLCIVPMMMIVPMLGGKGGGPWEIAGVFAAAILMVVAVLAGSKLVLPRVMRLIARDANRELFLLSVLAVGGMIAWLVSLTGLSFALGAFLAGVALAETQYSHQAMADVVPLRSLMMCVFFVAIGTLLDPAAVAAAPGLVVALFLAIGLVKLGVGAAVFLALRFPVRTALVAAAALAQVGEFSLVLAGKAQVVGLLTVGEERAFLAAAILTIAITPLVVAQSPRAVDSSRALRMAARLLDGREEPPVAEGGPADAPHVIVAGLGVGGRTVVDAVERVGLPVTIVEMNPDTVLAERARGRTVVYGDVMSDEVLAHAGIERALAVVIVISKRELAHEAARHVHRLRPGVPVILRTRFASDEGAIRAEGLEVVSEEFSGAVTMAATVLRRLGHAEWEQVVEALIDAHERLGVDDEGSLGAPPVGVATRRLSEPAGGRAEPAPGDARG
jgi:CPA2 family monovalent cation:H+ antiporter-2